MTIISVLAGSWVGKEILFSPRIMLAGVIGFMVCAFGNIINDLRDIEIDKINSPGRPLPSGRAKKVPVVMLAIIFAVLGLGFAVSLGLLSLLVVFAALSLLFLYALILKRTIFSNLIVALIAGLSFIYGGLITGNRFAIIPFVFAIFIHLAREIIKDVIDMKGDVISGVHSLPIVFGRKRACHLSSILLGLLCLVIPLPYIFNILSANYLIIVIVLVYPAILYLILRLFKNPDKKELVSLSATIKMVMGLGLISFILG